MKNIEDDSIREFIETTDGLTPDQINGCEVYSDPIEYFLGLFKLYRAENIICGTDTLEDLRKKAKKYIATDLFEYMLHMSRSEFEETLEEIQSKYPEFCIIAKNGKVIYRLDLVDKRRHKDFMEYFGRLHLRDEPEIDI